MHSPFTHWCEVCVKLKAKNNKKPSVGVGGERRGTKVPMNYTFMSGDGEKCDELRALVVLFTVSGVVDGAVATTALRSKTDRHVVRIMKAFFGLRRGRPEEGQRGQNYCDG